MNKHFALCVGKDGAGLRIDRWLANSIAECTRSSISRLFRSESVKVNGSVVLKSKILQAGDKVEVVMPKPHKLEAKAQDLPLEIVFEDNDLIVVNKAKSMVVHPCVGHESETLVNALLFHCEGKLSGINGALRPGILHRLDKDTSGLLVVAKNDYAHIRLAQQIKDHDFYREYRAIVYGGPKEQEGVITLPIGRSEKDRKKMAVTWKNSRPAVTRFWVLERSKHFSLLKLKLETGRTHQIRAHMAHLGHPIAGDVVYGPKNVITELNGQCLHAKKLGFVHPRTKDWVQFDSELPSCFTEFWNKQICLR